MPDSEVEYPRLLADTAEFARTEGRGALWKLAVAERDLDANLIALLPGDHIDSHREPHLDVLINVVDGSGRLDTEIGPVELRPGALVWLPKSSRRGVTAGAEGLRYLTVHRRRQPLKLGRVEPDLDR